MTSLPKPAPTTTADIGVANRRPLSIGETNVVDWNFAGGPRRRRPGPRGPIPHTPAPRHQRGHGGAADHRGHSGRLRTASSDRVHANKFTAARDDLAGAAGG